ncbi:hypothetical protein [Lysinibacillus fusiformis]|uniref:hypothetical protein n=1 Tax=Lysinibacillus fusiformis TaxID=28031 RepID=UPI0035573365
MNFLFWNVNRQSIGNTIVELVEENDIDVLILAEYVEDIKGLLKEFSESKRAMYYYENIPHYDRLKILTSFSTGHIERVKDDKHYMTLRLPHENLGFITLFAVHFFSKLHRNESDFNLKTYKFSSEVLEIENRIGSDNTVICGDFNMNPYEEGMISVGKLHAFPTKKEARKLKRTFDFEDYKMFYNPMWKLIGDDEILGTYHYASPHSNGLYWNIFDQVIIRPALIDNFGGLTVIRNTQKTILADENGILVSDHLPIMFSLK